VINLDKIFQSFSLTPTKPEESPDLDILEHPGFKIGLVKKMIYNIPIIYLTTLKQYPLKLSEEKRDLLKSLIRHQTYNKAYNFIEEINLEKDFDIIKLHMDDNFYKIIEYMIEYFISEEEYEKCAVLNKFLQKDLESKEN
jgi:hypothetical protein